MPLWTKNDTESGKPKYLNSTEKASTYLVDEDEAQYAATRARGIQTPGWVHYTTYTDSDGNTRHKAETLVAFGDTTGVGDEANDSIIVAATITIINQPVSYTANTAAANTAAFNVAATIDTGTFVYAWESRANTSDPWAAISDGIVYSGVDSANLVVLEVAGLDQREYRVVLSSSDTDANDVTSTTATLTVV